MGLRIPRFKYSPEQLALMTEDERREAYVEHVEMLRVLKEQQAPMAGGALLVLAAHAIGFWVLVFALLWGKAQ